MENFRCVITIPNKISSLCPLISLAAGKKTNFLFKLSTIIGMHDRISRYIHNVRTYIMYSETPL